MPQSSKSKVIVLYPPKITESKLSNKYELVVEFKWGDFSREIKVSKEYPSYTSKFVEELNKVFLEAVETNPYLIQ